MKKLLLIAALILLTLTQLVSAQDGPVTIPSPEEPQQTAAGATFEEQVLEIVNQERWDNGQLPPLKGNQLLNNSAEGHSTNMAVRDFFDHCDLDTKKTFDQRIIDAGYNYWYAAENIAIGQQTPANVMSSWMNSSGHKANILSTNYREIGIGYYFQSNDQANVRDDTNEIAMQTEPMVCILSLLDSEFRQSQRQSILWSSTVKRTKPIHVKSICICMERAGRRKCVFKTNLARGLPGKPTKPMQPGL